MEGGDITNDGLMRDAATLMLKQHLTHDLTADEDTDLNRLQSEICERLTQAYGFKKEYSHPGKDGSLREDIFQETIEITLSETFSRKDFLDNVLSDGSPWEFLKASFLLNRLIARTRIFKLYTEGRTESFSFDNSTDSELYRSGSYHDPRKIAAIEKDAKQGLKERTQALIRKTVSLSMAQLKNDYRKIIEYRTGRNGEILTYREIATKLHITENNARKRYHDAMKKLLTCCSMNLVNLIAREKDEPLRFLLNKYKEIIDERLVVKPARTSNKKDL